MSVETTPVLLYEFIPEDLHPLPLSLVVNVYNQNDIKPERRVITIPPNTSLVRHSVRVGRTINEETRPRVNNLFFDSLVISRNHAEVYCDSFARVFIRDLGSANGTYVDDKRLSPSGEASEAFELVAGQRLALGVDLYREDEEDISHHSIYLTIVQAGPSGLSQKSMRYGKPDQNDEQVTPTPIKDFPTSTKRGMSQILSGRSVTSPLKPKERNHSRIPSQGHADRVQLLPGDYFDRYDLNLARKADMVSIIGTGGSGTVFLMRAALPPPEMNIPPSIDRFIFSAAHEINKESDTNETHPNVPSSLADFDLDSVKAPPPNPENDIPKDGEMGIIEADDEEKSGELGSVSSSQPAIHGASLQGIFITPQALEKRHRSLAVFYSHTHFGLRTPYLKVIRLVGSVRQEDIANEVRALDKLCIPDQGKVLVRVFHHEQASGGLLDLHQIDMELCLWNLQDEIQKKPPSIRDILMQLQRLGSVSGVIPQLEQLKVEINKVTEILYQITEGLDYIHSLQEVHRDLKPENVLFSAADKRWKIGDFGSTAEGTSKRLKVTTFSRGTSVYRGPELLNEESGYNVKTDIWAFGCIAYELCTKEKAYVSDWHTMNYRHTCHESQKQIFDGSLGWPDGDAGALAKKISEECVGPCLNISWTKDHRRPSF